MVYWRRRTMMEYQLRSRCSGVATDRPTYWRGANSFVAAIRMRDFLLSPKRVCKAFCHVSAPLVETKCCKLPLSLSPSANILRPYLPCFVFLFCCRHRLHLDIVWLATWEIDGLDRRFGRHVASISHKRPCNKCRPQASAVQRCISPAIMTILDSMPHNQKHGLLSIEMLRYKSGCFCRRCGRTNGRTTVIHFDWKGQSNLKQTEMKPLIVRQIPAPTTDELAN